MNRLQTLLAITILTGTLVLSVPVSQEDEDSTYGVTNSKACAETYHGRCIDTFKYQCMGINIPGVCGNLTHFVSTENKLTRVQCCNGWQVVPIGGTVVVTDAPPLQG